MSKALEDESKSTGTKAEKFTLEIRNLEKSSERSLEDEVFRLGYKCDE